MPFYLLDKNDDPVMLATADALPEYP